MINLKIIYTYKKFIINQQYEKHLIINLKVIYIY